MMWLPQTHSITVQFELEEAFQITPSSALVLFSCHFPRKLTPKPGQTDLCGSQSVSNVDRQEQRGQYSKYWVHQAPCCNYVVWIPQLEENIIPSFQTS